MARTKRSRRSLKKDEAASSEAKKGKKSSNDNSDDHHTVFGEIVGAAGVFLKSGDRQDEIGVDIPIFQKRLVEAIKNHKDYPKIIDEFVESLQERCEGTERFRLSLMPILISEDSEGSIHGHCKESLMRILLGIDLLQPSIANMLLEKLPELIDEDKRHDNGESNTARLIMNQFRWLDRIVKSRDLTDKMLEMVSITSPDVQHEIITCLPEVVDDAEHVEVARQLREILLQNTGLAVPILDALSNLNLRQELLAEIRGSVLQMLPSAKLEDLPVITKFIFQSVVDNDAFEVISELRSNLDFNSLSPPQSSSTPLNPRRPSDSAEKSGELLTLDSIRSGIRFQKSVAEGWIKAIDSINSSAAQKVIDLFVLLILHSTGNRKKNVESLLRNKIKMGHFTEEMLSSAFASHSQVLKEYFANILCLGEVLLRSPDPAVCSYACAIYRHAFIAFDLYYQQEVVGALVTHIGSGFAGEADASLDVLSDLVDSHPTVMAPFAVFIKGILDYLDNLSLSQIRKVFSMLSTLAFSSRREGAMIQDDVHIVIRKQLSSDCPKYKRIGIIGAVMIVRSMARHRSTEGEDSMSTASQFHSSISNDVYKQIVNLLDMVRSSVSRVPEAAALFYDELTRVIEQGDVDRKVKNWISETVVSDFQDDFLVDREAPLPADTLPIDHVYALDEAEEGSIALNMLPLLLAGTNNKQPASKSSSVASLVCLSPHFRLLRICEQSQHNNDLEGIDALLGCPLVSFKPDMLDNLQTLAQADREVICGALFYTVNWFIELINGFSTQTDPEMRGKTLTRLNDITSLYKQIENVLAATSTFSPPLATFDCESSVPLLTKPVAKGKRPRKQPKGSDAKKLDETIEKVGDKENDKDLDGTCITTIEKDKGPIKTDKVTPVFTISQCRPYLRELDLNVFNLLKCGFVSRAILDSDMNTEETTILRIQAPHLYFLLDDLSRKLNHSLSACASSRRSFLKARHDKQVGFSNLSQNSSKEVAIFMVDLLPVLCDHLEATSAFFQTLLAANDGIVDGPGSNTEEASTMNQCYHLLFSCLQTLFSWSGFLGNSNIDLYKKALTVLSSRTKLSTSTQAGLQDLLRQSFHYLEQFSSTITDMSTALTLTKLLVVLSERANSKDINAEIAHLTGGFLKKEWIKNNGEKESGPKYNEALQYLLRFYLSFSDDTMSSVEEISACAFPELIEEDGDNVSTSYPTLTRATAPSFYRAILEELILHLKLTQSTPVKRTDIDQSKERLSELNIVVREFHIVINLVKAFEQRQVLSSALKYGRIFVETFLRLGMPVLDVMLRFEKDTVHGLLKNLQQSTRCLQHFCGHTKVVKDLALTNHVPAMKKTLELFVFRVKAMLALNECHEAFWMGNLKNRDIQGQEILSQQSTNDDDEKNDDDGDEEEMEVDKDDDDEDEEVDNAEAESIASHDTGGDDNEDEDSCSETF